MASMAILGLMMVMLFSVFEQVNKAWLGGENRVETFTQARAILDIMSRELSQAITTTNIPFYGDLNQVHFVAPVNTDQGNQADLCEVGYVFDRVNLTVTRQLTQSTNPNWNFYGNALWWQTFDAAKAVTLANDTILNLTLQYLDVSGNPITPPLNNVHKLPYAVIVSLDAVDSRTAARLKLIPNVGTAWRSITNSTLRSFSTTIYLPNISP